MTGYLQFAAFTGLLCKDNSKVSCEKVGKISTALVVNTWPPEVTQFLGPTEVKVLSCCRKTVKVVATVPMVNPQSESYLSKISNRMLEQDVRAKNLTLKALSQ